MESEGDYHLVFLSGVYYGDINELKISFIIDPVHYEVSEDLVIASCTVGTDNNPCSVNVPLTGATALLTFMPNDNERIDWMYDRASLMASCSSRRIWMIVVVSIAAIVGCVVLIILFGAGLHFLFKCCRKKRQTVHASTIEDTIRTYPPPMDRTPLIKDAVSAPLITPPSNPNFSPYAPTAVNYGSSEYAAAPPPYKP